MSVAIAEQKAAFAKQSRLSTNFTDENSAGQDRVPAQRRKDRANRYGNSALE
jgi:hypothetical protein